MLTQTSNGGPAILRELWPIAGKRPVVSQPACRPCSDSGGQNRSTILKFCSCCPSTKFRCGEALDHRSLTFGCWLGGGADLVSIAVEGKVSEPFGPTLEEWRKDASQGKEDRLEFICEQLGINPSPPGSIRYQLLHRAASAVVEARRFNAAHAMMLVHSFSPSDEWFDDYAQFLTLFGTSGATNTVTSAGKRAGLSLYFAWVCGEGHYLRM